MNILVTGGAGYIGSVTVNELTHLGHNVIVADHCRQSDAQHVKFLAKLEVGDLTNRKFVDGVFEKYDIDAVMHLASIIEISESMKNPLNFYHNNIVASLNLLHAMKNYGVSKIVYSSSASVYGDPTSFPITEEHPLKPINHYGYTKAMVEHVLSAAKKNGILPISLRYFNAAGSAYKVLEKHEPETHLIPRLFEAILQEKEFSVFGNTYPTQDGTCVRDFVHVKDIAAAHALALKALEKGVTGAFNLGSGKGYSIQEVIQIAEKVTGKKVNVTFQEKREGDPPTLVASNKLAKEILGWKPQNDIHSILQSVWQLQGSDFA